MAQVHLFLGQTEQAEEALSKAFELNPNYPFGLLTRARLRSDEGEVLYRQCGPQHHHHLVCRSCGVTVEVDGPAVEKLAVKAAETHGFTEVTHVVELFGLCADCSRR